MPFRKAKYYGSGINQVGLFPSGSTINGAHPLSAVVEQAYGLFEQSGGKWVSIGGKPRPETAGATGYAWAATRGGRGVKLAGSGGYFTGVGHQLIAWSRELLFVAQSATASALVCIAESPGNTTTDRAIWIDSSGKLNAYTYSAGSLNIAGTTVVSVGTAYHVIVTASSGGLFLYVNGRLENSVGASTGGYALYTSPELVFGWGVGSSTGSVSATCPHVILYCIEYNKVLTASQVSDRYKYQPDIFGPTPRRRIISQVGGGGGTFPFWTVSQKSQIIGGGL